MSDDRLHSVPEGSSIPWHEIVPPVLMALGAITLLRTSRVLSVALLGGWIYNEARKSDSTRDNVTDKPLKRLPAPKNIDDQTEASFPASDPPSFSGNIAGAPD